MWLQKYLQNIKLYHFRNNSHFASYQPDQKVNQGQRLCSMEMSPTASLKTECYQAWAGFLNFTNKYCLKQA